MAVRFLLLSLLALAACSSTGGKEDPPEPARAAPLSSELPKGSLYRTSHESDFMDMIDHLAGADVVYVGEVHTNARHHLVQLRVIEHLLARGRLHAVGMEMFQRKFQPALDDYVRGTIDEKELLERTEWKKRWRFDFGLYRPILELARKHRLKVLALNVEDEIRKPASKGGLDAVPEELRRTLPALHLKDKDHRAYLEAQYKAHFPKDKEFDQERFERFYLVMCLWDDVMANTIVTWFRTAPDDGQIVVLAGGGHIANRYGIPGRVHRRNGKAYQTVIPRSVDKAEPDREVFSHHFADFVWLTKSK